MNLNHVEIIVPMNEVETQNTALHLIIQDKRYGKIYNDINSDVLEHNRMGTGQLE